MRHSGPPFQARKLLIAALAVMPLMTNAQQKAVGVNPAEVLELPTIEVIGTTPLDRKSVV